MRMVELISWVDLSPCPARKTWCRQDWLISFKIMQMQSPPSVILLRWIIFLLSIWRLKMRLQCALCCSKHSDNVSELCSDRCCERQKFLVGKFPFCAVPEQSHYCKIFRQCITGRKHSRKKKKSKNLIKRNKHHKKSCWRGMKRRFPLTLYLKLQYKLISAGGTGR